jgi:hypothetical protein
MINYKKILLDNLNKIKIILINKTKNNNLTLNNKQMIYFKTLCL